MSRVCETCFGRGFTVKTTVEEDADGIEMETQETVPCPDCNANGKAPFNPEEDGDYDI